MSDSTDELNCAMSDTTSDQDQGELDFADPPQLDDLHDDGVSSPLALPHSSGPQLLLKETSRLNKSNDELVTRLNFFNRTILRQGSE
jgi:hypothetical protein